MCFEFTVIGLEETVIYLQDHGKRPKIAVGEQCAIQEFGKRIHFLGRIVSAPLPLGSHAQKGIPDFSSGDSLSEEPRVTRSKSHPSWRP